MNKKMSDNEIIKALECCRDNNCHECPIKGCTDNIFGEALDLINRQKAEIKQLETIERFAAKTIEKQSAENEKLRNAFMGECMLSACSREKEIKDEAIKEFAEKLRNCFCVSGEYLDIMSIIDNLLKEMKEVSE